MTGNRVRAVIVHRSAASASLVVRQMQDILPVCVGDLQSLRAPCSRAWRRALPTPWGCRHGPCLLESNWEMPGQGL